jgi:hypothetical protein
MHPQLILMVAQQQIADLRRGADRDRLVQAATTASSSDAAARPSPPRSRSSPAPPPRPDAPGRTVWPAKSRGDRRMPAPVAKQGHTPMSVASPCRQDPGRRPSR